MNRNKHIIQKIKYIRKIPEKKKQKHKEWIPMLKVKSEYLQKD